MDNYMRSVGFAELLSDVRFIKKDIFENPDKRIIFGFDDESTFVEYYKMYGKDIGVLARGYLDDNEHLHFKSIEPFALSDTDTVVNKYIVEYSGGQPVIIFEDVGTGNELVFRLNNKIDFYKDEKGFINYGRSVEYSRKLGLIKRKINLAALSVYGSVILPVYKSKDDDMGYWDQEVYYKSLVFRLNEGDNEANEILRLYAEESSSVLRERLSDEDLLSVVEGYFLPMDDNETDYSILGEIEGVKRTYNELTGEEILKLALNITGSRMQLFINTKDIIGRPTVGMRFMGTCRLAGSVII